MKPSNLGLERNITLRVLLMGLDAFPAKSDLYFSNFAPNFDRNTNSEEIRSGRLDDWDVRRIFRRLPRLFSITVVARNTVMHGDDSRRLRKGSSRPW